ncbi:MAG: NAD(P)H-hydrate epimerase [Caldilineaceae bacterium]
MTSTAFSFLGTPTLTTQQMVEVDRLMIEEYGITLLQMMENAGRNLALLAKRLLDGDIMDRPIVVLTGRGNNGGGGLAAARHLLNWGAWVQVVLTAEPAAYRDAPAHQLAILQKMGAPLAWAEEGWELPPADLLIDALIGYGLRGQPTGAARNLIQLANSSAAPILSLDAPSGLDTASGQLYDPHINAHATMTLALPKTGLFSTQGRAAVGDLYLADISVPPGLYERLGLNVGPIFAEDTVIKLDVTKL